MRATFLLALMHVGACSNSDTENRGKTRPSVHPMRGAPAKKMAEEPPLKVMPPPPLPDEPGLLATVPTAGLSGLAASPVQIRMLEVQADTGKDHDDWWQKRAAANALEQAERSRHEAEYQMSKARLEAQAARSRACARQDHQQFEQQMASFQQQIDQTKALIEQLRTR